jgi:uncharacterized NAD(P)/FAD-binding protein YdhS
MIKNRICVIGSGATAIYVLKNFVGSAKLLDVTILEASSEVGKGMPYRPDMNADYMLCNAFSREIPRITRSLIEWLEDLPKYELNEWELSSHDISPRAFYPRLLIGEFLSDEFTKLCELLRQQGHNVTVKMSEPVTDIISVEDGSTKVKAKGGVYQFDHVIIASGHSWPTEPKIGNADLVSPWPYTNVTTLQPNNIAILGSSLSAIDVVIALGNAHGTFSNQNGGIVWSPGDDVPNLHVTMLSKMGIMPEGDFYYPYPYLPLEIFSTEAVDAEIEKGEDKLLERLFKLFYKELEKSDPTYLVLLGAAAKTVEGFSEAYFKSRQELGGLKALKVDFVKTRLSMREKKTIAYRYVLLRAHENFDRALRHMNPEDWKLFSDFLVPVFADSYAAVPHLSLARIIAMFNAGVLSLKATGNDADFANNPRGGITVETEDGTSDFNVMIDARGQASASLDKLPFPSLVKIISDKDKPLEAPFKVETDSGKSTSIYCLALPQILERHPFSQGLANCADNGKIVAGDLLKRISLPTLTASPVHPPSAAGRMENAL